MPLALSTTMPAEEYNMLVVFSSIFLIIWGLYSSTNFYRALKCRASSLSGRLVSIRGLGETLHYFDSATKAHVSSLIQTRQSEPPTKMRFVYVPFILKGCKLLRSSAEGADNDSQHLSSVLNSSDQRDSIELSIWCSFECEVYVMQDILPSDVDNQYDVHRDFIESCRLSGQVVSKSELISSGQNTIRVTLEREKVLPAERSTENTRIDKSGMAVIVVPCSSLDIDNSVQKRSLNDTEIPNPLRSQISATSPPPPQSPSSASPSRINFGPFWVDKADSCKRKIEFSSLRDVESSDVGISTTDLDDDEKNDYAKIDFGLYFLEESNGSVQANSFVVGVDGAIFSPTEMFGLSSDSSANQEDEDAGGECLICLTDPKEVLLLPCKHFCVCSDCFVHLDKCPVCRASFDKYVVIEKQPTAQIVVPKYEPVDDYFGNVNCDSKKERITNDANNVTASLIDDVDEVCI